MKRNHRFRQIAAFLTVQTTLIVTASITKAAVFNLEEATISDIN